MVEDFTQQTTKIGGWFHWLQKIADKATDNSLKQGGMIMPKFDDFDLDIRTNISDEGTPTATTGYICQLTLSVCVDTVISVVASQCCTYGCTDLCGEVTQGCSESCDKTISVCRSYCGSGCRR